MIALAIAIAPAAATWMAAREASAPAAIAGWLTATAYAATAAFLLPG